MSALQQGTALTGLGIALVLVVGWLFSLLIDLQRETRQEVEQLAVEVARLGAHVGECEQ